MPSDYIHVEIETVQSSKKPGMPCGDVIAFRRSTLGTILVCADGLGSGIRAHIGAQMCVARLFESISQGFSLRKAFFKVATTMQHSRDPGKPFAAFSIASIRPDGNTTVLSYDAPAPILVGKFGATALENRPFSLPGGLAVESNCQLDIDEGILLMSDGITQAGIGYGSNTEMGTEGVLRMVDEAIHNRMELKEIPHRIHKEALQRWHGIFDRPVGRRTSPSRLTPFQTVSRPSASDTTLMSPRSGYGDDCSISLAFCRNGQTLNIFTGPPADQEKDEQVIRKFLDMPGLKVICGGTTANIVARYLHEPVLVEQEPTSLIAPPRYEIEGIDLVTEGAVTLNQVYNIMDKDTSSLNEDSGVTELRLLLEVADRINFIVGGAENNANADITFLQRGVLQRKVLIPHIIERLENEGKLVTVQYV